jgi:hypothetical protein
LAKRPINKKRANQVRKMLRRELPAYIDLVQWLKDRRYAQTTGQAEKMILDGRVRSESHKLGIGKGLRVKKGTEIKILRGGSVEESDWEEVPVVNRHVPAKLRGTINVVAA